MRRCERAATARCWQRPRPGWPRRRCGSGAGPYWPWPSTRRAARGKRCAPCTGPARCWPASSVWTPDPTWCPWRRRSCARTPRWWPMRRSPSPAPCARTWAWCPTTWPTPTPSSGAMWTWRRACAGWRRSGCWRWWGRRAAASPRWCGPVWPPRSNAMVAGWWWSPPVPTPATPSPAYPSGDRRRCWWWTSARRP